MSTQKIPAVPKAASIYGTIVYWVTIISCTVCMVGPVISVAFPEKNIMNPYKLFDAIFQGKDAATIWQEVGGGFPGGHFYFKHLNFGDAITQAGIAFGCSVALWGLLASAVVYAKEKNYVYIGLALWVSLLVGLSMIGIVSSH